jgi:hypothetical protein
MGNNSRYHEEDEESGGFWDNMSRFSKNPDRPKRNSKFLVVLALAGVVGVVVFSILAVTTRDSRTSCPCAQPFR